MESTQEIVRGSRGASRGLLAAGLVCALVAGCGGDGEEATVQVLVFGDWNADGQLTPPLEGGVESVGVSVDGQDPVRTGQDGQARIEVSTKARRLRLSELPPEFAATTSAEVELRLQADQVLELRFGIRPAVPPTHAPFKVVALGDSITAGFTQNQDDFCICWLEHFEKPLEERLKQGMGHAKVVNRAVPGTKARCGADVLDTRLSGATAVLPCTCGPDGVGELEHPDTWDREPFGPSGYLLVLYGANDLNNGAGCIAPTCRQDRDSCQTLEQLELILRRTRAAGTIPVIGTLPPGHKSCDRNWTERYNADVLVLNQGIRQLAQETDTILVDYWKVFVSDQTPPVAELISDSRPYFLPNGRRVCGRGLHPTREGYRLMAEEAARAILGLPSPYADTPITLEALGLAQGGAFDEEQIPSTEDEPPLTFPRPGLDKDPEKCQVPSPCGFPAT